MLAWLKGKREIDETDKEGGNPWSNVPMQTRIAEICCRSGGNGLRNSKNPSVATEREANTWVQVMVAEKI